MTWRRSAMEVVMALGNPIIIDGMMDIDASQYGATEVNIDRVTYLQF